jgi:LPXTG-motif cell wall-anchored protein
VAASARPGPSPFGPLADTPDENGLLLPEGFTSRVIARSREPVPGTTYVWPAFPDGAATFPTPDGGWIHVVNSEVPGGGGVSAVRFEPDGTIADAYSILTGTSLNCAGGPTPWGTWLSCEEYDLTPRLPGVAGMVWECDPTRPGQGVARPAMGRFSHEAAAVDPVGKRVYLTEDQPDGRFYRFTPKAYPDLSAGLLEFAAVDGTGRVRWIPVPDPSATTAPTRAQVPESTPFKGGEGCWYDAGHVYFATKGDNRIWDHDIAAQRISVLYDAAALGDAAPLTGVDNVTVSPDGHIFVAEDGGNMEINVITPDGVVAPILRYPGNEESEITGPVFDPSGTRLYFSSQRGPSPSGVGITFEVTGPFRRNSAAAAPPPGAVPSTTVLGSVASRSPAAEELPATGSEPHTAGAGLLLALAGAAGWVLARRAQHARSEP